MISVRRGLWKRLCELQLQRLRVSASRQLSSSLGAGGGDDEWNLAWEMAWLPEPAAEAAANKSRAAWEGDVNFGLGGGGGGGGGEGDGEGDTAEAKEFLAEMDEKWSDRKGRRSSSGETEKEKEEKEKDKDSQYRLENMKKDYRLSKQKIHAALWMKEIEKREEAKFGTDCDDIERLMDTCSDIFDSGKGIGFVESDKTRGSESKLQAEPEGWEKMSKTGNDGNVWDMTQREEDILLQEFDRRLAFNKYQISSFLKTHIFSRRRPVDGWKYMIEDLGPNARKGKGSVSRLPTLSDTATQPYKEDKTTTSNTLKPFQRR